jgi:hypothetical protein
MSIKQFNGEWICREDRVLFRFNTHQGQEFSFWLTRYVLKGLLQGAKQMAVQALETQHAPEVAQQVQSFQQASVAQQLNFEDNFESSQNKPMGEAPLLVTGLTLNAQDEMVTLKLDLDLEKSVQVQMPAHVFQVMLALLDKLQGVAQWNVGHTADPSELADNPAAEAPRIVH